MSCFSTIALYSNTCYAIFLCFIGDEANEDIGTLENSDVDSGKKNSQNNCGGVSVLFLFFLINGTFRAVKLILKFYRAFICSRGS